MDILLVEPDFPYARKSINHHESIPIGLLKIASYYLFPQFNVERIKLVKGQKDDVGFYPDKILITSLFTYWSDYAAST